MNDDFSVFSLRGNESIGNLGTASIFVVFEVFSIVLITEFIDVNFDEMILFFANCVYCYFVRLTAVSVLSS